MATLDAIGITVDLRDMSGGKRFGNPRWTLPMGGGVIRDGNVTVEVRPTVDMTTERWRDYDELERLADHVEHVNGFMRSGDELRVGEDIVVGRDALDLLTVLWKRAADRAADADPMDAAYRQGYNAAIHEHKAKVKELAASMTERYPSR